MTLRYTKYDWIHPPSSSSAPFSSGFVANRNSFNELHQSTSVAPSPQSSYAFATTAASQSPYSPSVNITDYHDNSLADISDADPIESVERWRGTLERPPTSSFGNRGDGLGISPGLLNGSSSSSSSSRMRYTHSPLPHHDDDMSPSHSPLPPPPPHGTVHQSVNQVADYILHLRQTGQPVPRDVAAFSSSLRLKSQSPSPEPSSPELEDGDEGFSTHAAPPSTAAGKKGKMKGNKLKEEEARQKLLKRNRLAAIKSRQKKKEFKARLEMETAMHQERNQQLQYEISGLLEEMKNLKTRLRDIQTSNSCQCSQSRIVEYLVSIRQD